MPKTLAYATVHNYLRAEFGPASSCLCAECGQPAHQWSYDHADPFEVYGPTKGDRDDSRAYSLDFDHYRPLCRSCHVLLDHGGSVETCKHGHTWSPENTHIKRNGNRECRTCKGIRQRARRQRLREERMA